jgi:hypothetical protein
MPATNSATPDRLASTQRIEAIGRPDTANQGATSGGLAFALQYPDLNDPFIRQLPISALALALAMFEASADLVPRGSAAGLVHPV